MIDELIELRLCASTPLMLALMPGADKIALGKADIDQGARVGRSPPPKLSSPVAFSEIFVVRIALSGTNQGLWRCPPTGNIQDRSGGFSSGGPPRSCTGSPSATRNSRRMTLSSVRVLPTMSMRST